jgi:hypothetical protein
VSLLAEIGCLLCTPLITGTFLISHPPPIRGGLYEATWQVVNRRMPFWKFFFKPTHRRPC